MLRWDMHELEVFVLDVSHAVSTPAELAGVIGSRVNGGNHFMIASAMSAHPMLDLLVRGGYAVLHYFEVDGVAGDQADGTVDQPPEEVEFPHSRMGDTISMPGSVLIDEQTAIACVEQFAETLQRPTLVDWISL